MEAKMQDDEFWGDTRGLLKPDENYDPEIAYDLVKLELIGRIWDEIKINTPISMLNIFNFREAIINDYKNFKKRGRAMLFQNPGSTAYFITN